MAYHAPPPTYAQTQAVAPPGYNEYVQSPDYSAGPEVPLKQDYKQENVAGYGYPQHVSVPNAFDRYAQPHSAQPAFDRYTQPHSAQPMSVPNAFDRYAQPQPAQPAFDRYAQAQPAQPVAVPNAFDRYAQPQPAERIVMPNAFERDAQPGPRVPLNRAENNADAHRYPQPAASVAVPNAFDRDVGTGPSPSGAYQPAGGAFAMVDFPTTRYSPAETVGETETVGESAHYSYSNMFSDQTIRKAFIRKVYFILMCQLCVTVGFIAVFIFVEPVNAWIRRDGMWCYIVAYVTFLITYLVLICIPSVRRNTPGNFICLAVFTVAFSFLTATISSFHDTKVVLMAAGMTAAVCLALTLFAVQTKVDFTMCSGMIFALVMVLFIFGWACVITYYCWGFSHIMDTVYAGLACLVFAVLLVYNTQMIVGGRDRELSPEEYIFAALQLYLDVVIIFLSVLSLMGRKK